VHLTAVTTNSHNNHYQVSGVRNINLHSHVEKSKYNNFASCSYNKSQRDAQFLKLFDKILHMFRTGSLSIIRVSQHCIHVIGICHASSVGCR